MKSVFILPFYLPLVCRVLSIITFPPFGIPERFLKYGVPHISIPTTNEGNLWMRYLGMPTKFQNQEEIDSWWRKEEDGYKKFVTEQIEKEEEENKKKRIITPCSEEALEKIGDWGHYYDYGTKEIERFEKKNPVPQGKLSLMQSYKNLKELVRHRQRLEEEGYVTELSSGLIRECQKLRKWFEEEEKAGRIKCECKNCTSTRFTERYTGPEDGDYRVGMYSKEKK